MFEPLHLSLHVRFKCRSIRGIEKNFHAPIPRAALLHRIRGSRFGVTVPHRSDPLRFHTALFYEIAEDAVCAHFGQFPIAWIPRLERRADLHVIRMTFDADHPQVPAGVQVFNQLIEHVVIFNLNSRIPGVVVQELR